MQIQALRHQIRKQDRKQEHRVQEVKNLIQDQLKDKLARDMQCVERMPCVIIQCAKLNSCRTFINEQIKKETAIQVKEQVGLQLKDHLQFPLAEQLDGSQKQLIEVKQALVNSCVHFPLPS